MGRVEGYGGVCAGSLPSRGGGEWVGLDDIGSIESYCWGVTPSIWMGDMSIRDMRYDLRDLKFEIY